MTLRCTMILGDCLEVMPTLPKASVHMCFADLPYGVTGFKWDTCIIPKDFLHTASAVLRESGPIIATGNERFHMELACVWKRIFRYALVWDKMAPCNFLQASKRPMVTHEFVGVYGKTATYNPQKTFGHPPRKKTGERVVGEFIKGFKNKHAGKRKDMDDSRNPISILRISRDKRTRTVQGKTNHQKTHPSQKPIALLDWLIRTYSNPGENVLDPVAGSFTTCVSACLNGRNSVGIEKDRGYFEAGVERVRKACVDQKLDVQIEVRT